MNEGLISDFLQNIHEMQFDLEEQKTANVKLLLAEKLPKFGHNVFFCVFSIPKVIGKTLKRVKLANNHESENLAIYLANCKFGISFQISVIIPLSSTLQIN